MCDRLGETGLTRACGSEEETRRPARADRKAPTRQMKRGPVRGAEDSPCIDSTPSRGRRLRHPSWEPPKPLVPVAVRNGACVLFCGSGKRGADLEQRTLEWTVRFRRHLDPHTCHLPDLPLWGLETPQGR